MENQVKQQQANQIAEILNSIKNCHDCPIYNTCNEYENKYYYSLCYAFRDNDDLNITD